LKRLLILIAAALVPAAHGQDSPGAGRDHALTIYSRAQPGAIDPALYRPDGQSRPTAVPGYAVVRQTQKADLPPGASEWRVAGVASLIDPTTVSIHSRDDRAPVQVLEQSFEFDLVSSRKLLDRYLDRVITVTRESGNGMTEVSGTLLSTDGGLVLRQPGGGVQIINDYQDIKLPDLPGGLMTRPTLVWQVHSDAGGARPLQLSYQTEGLTWWADYNATLVDEQGCRLDLSAWVSIVNQSGAGYPDTRLKLIAGDVQRVQQQSGATMLDARRAVQAEQQQGFQEKAFFEYHLYTLPRRTSLPNNSTKQLELFPSARGVPCNREYVYAGGAGYPRHHSDPILDREAGPGGSDDVSVLLSFRNDEASGLGMPLPAGRLRINKQDTADGSLEFIGEDVIQHTPKTEALRVRLGNAFDVVGERRRTDYRVDTGAKTLRESFEIRIRNHKETPVTVNVQEVLYRWVNWDLLEASHDFDKLDARTVRFPVEVAAEGEATLRYEVRYSW